MTTALRLTRDQRLDARMKPRKKHVQMTVPMLTLATALHREGMSWKGCEIACQVIYGKSPGPSAFRSYLTDPQPRRKGAGVSRDPNRNGFPVRAARKVPDFAGTSASQEALKSSFRSRVPTSAT